MTTDNVQDTPPPGKTSEIVHPSKFANIEHLNHNNFMVWFKKEYNYWVEIERSTQSQKGSNLAAKITSQTASLVATYKAELGDLDKNKPNETLAFYDSNKGSLSLVQTFISLNLKHHLPMHDDPLAEEFKNACLSGNADAALYTYRVTSNQTDTHYLRGYNAGMQNNLANLAKEVDKKLAETTSRCNEQQGDIAEIANQAKIDITKLVSAGTSAISLSEPVKFWDDREKIHNDNARKYGKYASWSASVFAVVLILVIIYEYLSGVPHQVFGYDFTLPKSLTGIATILLTSTAGIWSTRIFIKLMMANLTLEIESIERSTMIKTFVAMKATEASIAQEAELLFYTSLFRPSNNVISEESTAPEFGKILDAILRAKTDKPTPS